MTPAGRRKKERYRALWQAYYRVPDEALRLIAARAAVVSSPRRPRWPILAAALAAGIAVMALAGILVARWARHRDAADSDADDSDAGEQA